MAKKLKTCREIGLRLQTYLDGELDDERIAQIRSHLDACVDCGLEADAFVEIKNELASLRPSADGDALARLKEFSARIADEAAQ